MKGSKEVITIYILPEGSGKNKVKYYEIRRGKDTLCSSTVPNLGYTPEYLKEILKDGYTLYCNGKRVKLCDIK